MFSVCCSGHQTEVLLGPDDIQSLRNDAGAIDLQHAGLALVGRQALSVSANS